MERTGWWFNFQNNHPGASRHPSWPGCAVQISQPERGGMAEILGIFVRVRELKNDIQENLSKLAP